MRLTASLGGLLVCLAIPGRSYAADGKTAAEVGAPMPGRGHQVTVLLGAMPTGHLVNHLTATVSYEWQFHRHLAWEVAHGTFAQGYRTKLGRELGRVIYFTTSFRAPEFPEIVGIVGSNLHLRARYDSSALMDSQLLSFEARLYGGPVAVFRRHAYDGDVTAGFDAGIQARSSLGERFSLLLDGGMVTHFPTQRWRDRLDELYVRAGVGVQF